MTPSNINSYYVVSVAALTNRIDDSTFKYLLKKKPYRVFSSWRLVITVYDGKQINILPKIKIQLINFYFKCF